MFISPERVYRPQNQPVLCRAADRGHTSCSEPNHLQPRVRALVLLLSGQTESDSQHRLALNSPAARCCSEQRGNLQIVPISHIPTPPAPRKRWSRLTLCTRHLSLPSLDQSGVTVGFFLPRSPFLPSIRQRWRDLFTPAVTESRRRRRPGSSGSLAICRGCRTAQGVIKHIQMPAFSLSCSCMSLVGVSLSATLRVV